MGRNRLYDLKVILTTTQGLSLIVAESGKERGSVIDVCNRAGPAIIGTEEFQAAAGHDNFVLSVLVIDPSLPEDEKVVLSEAVVGPNQTVFMSRCREASPGILQRLRQLPKKY